MKFLRIFSKNILNLSLLLSLFSTSNLLGTNKCVLPASDFVGDEVLPILLKHIKLIQPEGKLKTFFEEYQLRFNLLYAMPSKKQNEKQIKKILSWIRQVNQNFRPFQKRELMEAMRRWTTIILRDISPYLKKEEQQLITKRIETFTMIFSQKTPRLIPTFCLDKEFANTPEEIKHFKAEMNHLKIEKARLQKNANDIEQELIERLENHPGFEDHWYHYASFLLARGRLEEAEMFLRELLKHYPNSPQATELLGDVTKVKNVTDPLERATAIEKIMASYLGKALKLKKTRDRQLATPKSR